MDFLLTFYTQLDAIVARESLNNKKISVKLSPVPRVLSSSCGTCAIVKDVLKSDLVDIDFDCLYRIEGDSYIKEINNEE